MKRHLHLHLGRYKVYPINKFNYQIATGFGLMIDGYHHLVSIEQEYHLKGEAYSCVRVPQKTWSTINVYWLQILYGVTCIERMNIDLVMHRHFIFNKQQNRFSLKGMNRMIPLHMMIHDTRVILDAIGWDYFPDNIPIPNNFSKQNKRGIYEFTHQYENKPPKRFNKDGISEEIEQ